LPLPLLGGIALTDDVIDAGGSDDGHSVCTDEVRHAVVVIGMSMREKDREQRLPESVDLRTQSLAVALAQRRIYGDNAARRLDQIRIGEDSVLARRVTMNRCVAHSQYLSVNLLLRRTSDVVAVR